MKLRSPGLIRLVGFLAAVLLRCWMATLRYCFVHLGDRRHPPDPARERYLYVVWHEGLLLPMCIRTPIHLLISQHADGELISQVCQHLGYDVVRGSTTRGGTGALLQLRRVSKETHLLVTPDGPRGPRRRVQAGLIYLASRTGLPIVACCAGFARAWRARSWDRFALPWPGTRAVGVFLPAIHVPAGLDREQLEAYRQLVEEHMTAGTEIAERLAQGEPLGELVRNHGLLAPQRRCA